MGMVWILATPTVEDRDKGHGSPYTWGDYANNMASIFMIMFRLNHLRCRTNARDSINGI